jgi:hypothetical protein
LPSAECLLPVLQEPSAYSKIASPPGDSGVELLQASATGPIEGESPASSRRPPHSGFAEVH